jgi:hypothetical protein
LPLIFEVTAVMVACVAVADVELEVEFEDEVIVADFEFCVVDPPFPPLLVCEALSVWDVETSVIEVDEVVGPSRLCK